MDAWTALVLGRSKTEMGPSESPTCIRRFACMYEACTVILI